LLIHVIFNSATKLRSVVLGAPEDGHAPKKVKLFVNRPTIGFSEAEEECAVQEFDLSAAQVGGQPLALKYVLTHLRSMDAGCRPLTEMTG
jgi:hypothetical protein